MNLTQFPLFFEEKRDFFLQGANYFDFAREIGDSVRPFFSRRIGLADGLPQPIDFGAKLTGQAGQFDVGALQVRTRDTAVQAGADFSVLRVRRRIGQECMPACSTPAAATGLPARRRCRRRALIRCCARHASSAGRQSSGATGFSGRAVRSIREETSGAVRASRFRTTRSTSTSPTASCRRTMTPPSASCSAAAFGGYNPEVGYTWRFGAHPWLQSLQVEIDWDVLYDMDNRRVGETKQLKPLTVVFADGSEFVYEVHPTYERLERDFEISDGVTLPAGASYNPTRHEIGGSMSDRYRYPSGRK